MRQGQISIYYGMGKGKTAVAVGRGMRAIGEEQRVVMIQFLDYHNSKEIALLPLQCLPEESSPSG